MILIGGILEEDMQRIPMIGRYSIRFLRAIGVFKVKKDTAADAAQEDVKK